MKLEIVGIREQLARHLRSYYGAMLSSINCRREWMEFVIDYRESMDIHTRALAERIFPTVFEGITFEEFQEAVAKRKGQINDEAIVEVLEELVAQKKKFSVAATEKVDPNMPDEYINFGDVARQQLGMQCQHAVGYFKGSYGYPDLSDGLRVKGDPNMYYSFQIHKDDVAEFIARVQKYRHETVNLNPHSNEHVFTGFVCSCGYDAKAHVDM